MLVKRSRISMVSRRTSPLCSYQAGLWRPRSDLRDHRDSSIVIPFGVFATLQHRYLIEYGISTTGNLPRKYILMMRMTTCKVFVFMVTLLVVAMLLFSSVVTAANPGEAISSVIFSGRRILDATDPGSGGGSVKAPKAPVHP